MLRYFSLFVFGTLLFATVARADSRPNFLCFFYGPAEKLNATYYASYAQADDDSIVLGSVAAGLWEDEGNGGAGICSRSVDDGSATSIVDQAIYKVLPGGQVWGSCEAEKAEIISRKKTVLLPGQAVEVFADISTGGIFKLKHYFPTDEEIKAIEVAGEKGHDALIANKCLSLEPGSVPAPDEGSLLIKNVLALTKLNSASRAVRVFNNF
jgi:hypothetical protein